MKLTAFLVLLNLLDEMEELGHYSGNWKVVREPRVSGTKKLIGQDVISDNLWGWDMVSSCVSVLHYRCPRFAQCVARLHHQRHVAWSSS